MNTDFHFYNMFNLTISKAYPSSRFNQQSTEETAPDRNRDKSPCTLLKKALDCYLESLDLAVEGILLWETRKFEHKREMNELNDVIE